jgi:aspartate aminotransferase
MSRRFHPFRFSPAGLRGLEPSATLVINERVNEMWRQGQWVYHLGFGESRFPVHPKIAQALRENAYQHQYLPSLGAPELREKIATFYEERFNIPAMPEHIIVGPGSKALIYALLLALDGELMLPTPSWVSYQPQAHLVGKRVNWIAASAEEGWELTLQAIEDAVEQAREAWGNPGIVLLNSPNNPTGRMLPMPFLESFAQYAREQGLAVLSDEIYGLVEHGRMKHRSIARYYPEGTIVLGGLSKHLSLGGWRLGVAIFPPNRAGAEVLRAVRTIASETWSATTAPVQFAALMAYGMDPDVWDYIQLCTHLHAIRTQYLWQHLVEMGVRVPQPDGAFYLFPDFARWREPLARLGIRTDTQLAIFLLDHFQLATLPGSVFGAPPEALALRLSSSYLDMETADQAQALMDRALSGVDDATLLREFHPNLNAAIAQFRRFIASLETDTVPDPGPEPVLAS